MIKTFKKILKFSTTYYFNMLKFHIVKNLLIEVVDSKVKQKYGCILLASTPTQNNYFRKLLAQNLADIAAIQASIQDVKRTHEK